jgi:hypothetical protein
MWQITVGDGDHVHFIGTYGSNYLSKMKVLHHDGY